MIGSIARDGPRVGGGGGGGGGLKGWHCSTSVHSKLACTCCYPLSVISPALRFGFSSLWVFSMRGCRPTPSKSNV